MSPDRTPPDLADLRRLAGALVIASVLALAAGLFATAGALISRAGADSGPVDPAQTRQDALVVTPASPIRPEYDLPTLNGQLAWTTLDGQQVTTRFTGLPVTARAGDPATVWVHQQTGHPSLTPWRVRTHGWAERTAGGATWLGIALLALLGHRLFRRSPLLPAEPARR